MSKFLASKSPRSGFQNSEVLRLSTPLCNLPLGPTTSAFVHRGCIASRPGAPGGPPKSVQISARFASPHLALFWGPTGAPKWPKIELQRPPKLFPRPLGAKLASEAYFGALPAPCWLENHAEIYGQSCAWHATVALFILLLQVPKKRSCRWGICFY